MRIPPILTAFLASPLGELLTGTAHDAHPTDVAAPLGVRFAGKTILALHVALERAATVRVSFDESGAARLSEIRNVKHRGGAELVDLLRAEATAAHAEWVVVVVATGWQAQLGHRAARPEPGENATAFSRFRLLFDSPELVIPRAQVDRVYAAIDHPVLDKSVVFSVRRREIDELIADVHRAGLGVASIRVGVAAQLESWLGTEGENGLARDILLTDGLSALLLNTDRGDFVAPRGAVEADQPRQAVQRPSAIEEDIVRFITANSRRPLTFIGPEDLCVAVKRQVPEAELIRPAGHPAHDTQLTALSAAVHHDLNHGAKDVRPALPRRWRRVVLGYALLLVLLLIVVVTNTAYALRVSFDSYRLERDAAARTAAEHADAVQTNRIATDLANATALRAWVSSNYHAQRFTHSLLRDIPTSAALDKLQIEVRDRQIVLTFVVLGDDETQLATHRAMERGIKELRYKIAGEDLPTSAAGPTRAIQYRLHIIIPDRGEAAAS